MATISYSLTIPGKNYFQLYTNLFQASYTTFNIQLFLFMPTPCPTLNLYKKFLHIIIEI